MKYSILRAGLMVGALGIFLTGCEHAGPTAAVRKSKPDDPTAWSDRDLARDDSDASAKSSSLPKSSRLPGTWSSEAQAVERSLGVGQ